MKKLIDISNGSTLFSNETMLDFGGDWGRKISSGEYAWLDVPTGEDPDDCILDKTGPQPKLVVNTIVKNTRLRKVYKESRTAQADSDVVAILGTERELTRVSRTLNRLYVATNVNGSLNLVAVNAAKQQLVTDIALLNQVDTIRANCETDITNYNNTHPIT